MRQQGLASVNSELSLLRLRWGCVILLGMAVWLCGRDLWAQENDAGQSDSAQSYPAPMLHVDTNLIQIPVLVLTTDLKKLSTQINSNRFSVSFNGGPAIRPSYVRQEGEESIHLAVVLDTRSLRADQLVKMDEAIANLAPSFLHERDRVSVYAIDCGTMRGEKEVPAEPTQLKIAVDRALSSWTSRQQVKKKAPCSAETHLWDQLAYVTNALRQQQGWRAIVAVTDGDDRKSRWGPAELTHLSQIDQVAIVGLDASQDAQRTSAQLTPDTRGSLSSRGLSSLGPVVLPAGETALWTLCELSGGMAMPVAGASVAKRMERIVEMLRERYILEFPRPPGMKAGNVTMSVKIDGMNAFIRPAGDGVPLLDQSFTADSTAGSGANSVAAPSRETAPIAPPQAEPTPQAAAPHESPAQPEPVQHPEAAAETAAEIGKPLLRLSTKLTVEDVTVTDAHRMPVHGLPQSDFSIKEDGQPQSIRNFEEYGTERPSENATPPKLPDNVFTNAQPPPPTTSAVNVLLLDDVTTGLVNRLAIAPQNVAFASQQSIKYLGKMPAGTEVAILELGRTLQVLQSLSTDRAVLIAAMKAVSYKPVAGAYVFPPGSLQQACEAANAQSELTVNGLKNAAAYLSGIKGRKNLIWFTPGIPWLTDYAQFSMVPCLVDSTQQLHQAYALLSAAQVAIYPIDPRGLFVDPTMSAEFSPKAGGPAMAARAAAFGGNAAAENTSLKSMAEATGGVPFFNRNDLDASVGEAIETGADYYSLSYVPPPSKHDGKYHVIDVKVDRPGLHLQYRPGYHAVDAAEPAQTSSEATARATAEHELLAAMGHGQAASTQLLFDVKVTPSTAPAKPGDPAVIGSLNPTIKHQHLVRYDVAYSLAPGQLALLESPDGTRKGAVEFAFAAYDGEGKILNVTAQTLRMRLRPDDELAQFMKYPMHVALQFDLPSGKIFLRLGVVDLASQRIGTLEIPETVAK